MPGGGGVGQHLPRTSGKALSEVTHGGLSTDLCSGGPANTCPGGELGGGKWCLAGAEEDLGEGAGPGLEAAVVPVWEETCGPGHYSGRGWAGGHGPHRVETKGTRGCCEAGGSGLMTGG